MVPSTNFAPNLSPLARFGDVLDTAALILATAALVLAVETRLALRDTEHRHRALATETRSTIAAVAARMLRPTAEPENAE